jgi:hypothetical protein
MSGAVTAYQRMRNGSSHLQTSIQYAAGSFTGNEPAMGDKAGKFYLRMVQERGQVQGSAVLT